MSDKMNARRQYRSVAFGTWQVGGARNLTERRSEEPTSRLKCSSPDLHNHINNLLSIEKRISRLGESSPNLSKLHHTHTQLSLGLPNKMSTSNSAAAHDFFSSTEYCQYQTSRDDIDSFNGNSKQLLQSEPIQAAFRKSRKDDSRLDETTTTPTSTKRNLKYSQSSRRKLETSAQKQEQQAHHRSHSAGPHTAYSTNSNLCASTSEMNRLTTTNNATTNTKFLRATKRFFKKIYSSATLPKKQTSTSVENFQKSSVFFDERKCIPVQPEAEEDDEKSYRTREDDYDDDDDTMRSENATMDISYPDSGFEMDRASTPEQSSVSMTSTSKSDENSLPMNFNNLFEHLKREMAEMRERDAQILADLQRVETQIQTVKQAQILAQLQDEFEPVESMQL
ncbi:unnamed protein product [Caenorhabditis angaria]|uniref:Uncharacterized protein n=1 Tax=Caenorhabditis angaria TaxID=860376 RepID=A0A9P1I749_9PELO|nr:unnamed protein product [Caenorhabditis angaria]